MKFEFNGQQYKTKPWGPVDGVIGSLVAFDTETSDATPSIIPDYVLGQAYAGGDTAYFIPLEHLGAFFDLHKDARFVMHNAPFDVAVVEKEIGFDFDAMIRSQRLFDTGIMFRLLQLATEGIVGRWAMDYVVNKLFGIKIAKDAEIRCNFGQYRQGNVVAYNAIPEKALRYAAIDPIATMMMFVELDRRISALNPRNYLSHKIQLMGAVALDKISKLGIGFDVERKESFVATIDAEIENALKVCSEYGWVPGKKGNTAEYERTVRMLGLSLPRTASGRISKKAEHLEEFRSHHSFVDSFLNYHEFKKLRDFVIKLNANRIHTKFNTLLETGRTSSSKPNIQNLPRKPGVRECFTPAKGHCFLKIDYSQLELCTLAQTNIDRAGSSKMAELINDDVDLHSWFGSAIAGKEIGKGDPERQWAKACNFGFPGGLGIRSFCDFARKTYRIEDMDLKRAALLKEKWLAAFPEMDLYLRDSLHHRYNFGSLGWISAEGAMRMFRNIVAGKPKKDGTDYAMKMKMWAFEEVLPVVAPHLRGTSEGSFHLLDQVTQETVEVRSGRLRGNVRYCQAKNTPFQGTASDGAKVALYRLIRAGYRVVNFIHDEFLIEVPLSADLTAVGKDVENIAVGAMKALVPDVKIKTELEFIDRWYKDAELLKDEHGQIQIYTEASA